MRSTVYLIILTLAISSNAFPQNENTSDKSKPFTKYRWSVGFGAAMNLNFISHRYELLGSVKYRLSDKSALRFELGTEIYKFVDLYPELPDPIEKNFGAGAYLMYYPLDNGVLKTYIAGGLKFYYHNSYGVGNNPRLFGNDFWKITSDITSIGYGIGFAVGTEWFPLSFISLIAELNSYAVIGNSTYRIKEENTVSRTIIKSDKLGEFSKYSGNMLRLGVNLYFNMPFL